MKRPRSSLADKRAAKGFTLLELLVVVVIIALLIAITATSLNQARQASRAVMCMNNFKTVAQEFFLFADGHTRTRRAASAGSGRLFSLEEFQEKLYRVHDYWDAGESVEVEVDRSKVPLACPGGPGSLRKQKDLPCSLNAVTPLENVSTAFNMRLYEVSVTVMGWPRLQRTRLSPRILEQPNVPLVFCADGAKAVENGVLPYFSAPPAGELNLYGTGQFWFPSIRHAERMNIAYIGGHVLRSRDPSKTQDATWRYQPSLQ